MTSGRRSTVAGRLHAVRANGALSVLAGLSSALVLAGAAVYTVEGVSCGDGGQYVRHASHVELIGGCVDGAELPHEPGPTGGPGGTRGDAVTQHGNYQQ